MGGGCDAPKEVITPKCADAACHGPPLFIFGDLVTNPASLITTQKTAAFPTCAGMPLINNTLPPDGVLIRRLEGDACGPGTRMPMAPDNDPLTAEQIKCVKDWVTAQLGGATLDENADDTGSLAQ
jgi:hypothetical protein